MRCICSTGTSGKWSSEERARKILEVPNGIRYTLRAYSRLDTENEEAYNSRAFCGRLLDDTPCIETRAVG
jgi:hypothetical protein